MEKSSTKIAVVIPVYNAARYLRPCIESILHQTFQDYKLILVDDGSTDESGKICDAYAEKDRRIHVLHQPNRGSVKARWGGGNVGECSEGRVCFSE